LVKKGMPHYGIVLLLLVFSMLILWLPLGI